MASETPLSDRLVARFKNNPVVAVLLALAFVVTTLATSIEAVRKLRALFATEAKPAVAVAPTFPGRWRSASLKDARNALEYHYLFDLKADGPRVYGTGRRLFAVCATRPKAGPCEGHGREVPLLDGTHGDGRLAFAADWGELPGAGPWTWSRVRERFDGATTGEGLRLVAQDDQNHPPAEVALTAVRE